MIKYNYAPQTAIGGRKENQDTEGSFLTKFGLLAVVCDGMGGAAGGKTASSMAVNTIIEEVITSSGSMPAQALATAIKKANQEIFNRSRQQPQLRGMGTTVTAILINEEKAIIAHAGDSRVYQLRDGKKVFRTNDHSKVFELVKRGILSEEQARLSEESNIIQRALGIAPDIDVEINDNIPFLKGDLFMLCTDGVCGALPEEDLLLLLQKEKNVKRLSEQLIQQIDFLGNQQGGGHDNLTVALLQPLINSKLDVIIDMKTKITIYALTSMVAILSATLIYLLLFSDSRAKITQGENSDLKKEKAKIDSLQGVVIRQANILSGKNSDLKKEKIDSSENKGISVKKQADAHSGKNSDPGNVNKSAKVKKEKDSTPKTGQPKSIEENPVTPKEKADSSEKKSPGSSNIW